MGWQMAPMNQQEIIFSPTSYIRVLWYRPPPYTIWVFVIGLCLVMGQLTLNGCAHWIWPNGYCAHLNLKSSHFPNNLMGGPVPSCQTYKLLSEDPCDIKLLSQPQKDKYELRN
jgi:hypothetical protein